MIAGAKPATESNLAELQDLQLIGNHISYLYAECGELLTCIGSFELPFADT